MRESACRLRDMLVMVRMDGACVEEEGTGFWGEAGHWPLVRTDLFLGA